MADPRKNHNWHAAQLSGGSQILEAGHEIRLLLVIWAVVLGDIGGGEMEKVMHSFPYDMQSLFPAPATATT
jgi:hypothetical protein